MIDSCELVIHPPTTKSRRLFYLTTKYLLMIFLLVSTLSIISIIISVFLAQTDPTFTPSTNSSDLAVSESELTKIVVNILQIRITLIVVYLMIGFIAAAKDDLSLMLFFTFLSSIGILTTSLELNDSKHRTSLLISSLILPIISFFHCVSIFIKQQDEKLFYQGYLEA